MKHRQYPLDGVGRSHHAGAMAVAVLTLVLAGVTLIPPPRPVAAAPRPIAAASPSPEAVPAGSPAASPATSTSPSPVPSSDADTKKIEMITDRMEHLNPALKDWTSDVAIDAKVQLMMLVMPIELHGKSYHKAPDKYRFELQNAPALLQRYQQVFGYRPIVLSEFVATMLPDETVHGRSNYVVRLDKKGSGGDFRSQTVWIDKENFTSPRRLYLYKDNGRIDVNFKWRKEKEYLVIDTMDAQLDFPKATAKGTVKAQYQSYQFNTGLDDSIFIEKKKVGTSPP